MQMKFSTLFAAASFAALPLFAGEPAAKPAASPSAEAPATKEAAETASRPPRLELPPEFRLPPPRPTSVGAPGKKTPEEEAHSRRMAAIAALRDTKIREAEALEEEARARKNEILKENEEAGNLAKKIIELQTELAAATNALEAIFLADAPLQAKVEQARAARDMSVERQKALNREVADAIRKRIEESQKATPEPRPTQGPGLDPPAGKDEKTAPNPTDK